MLIKSVVKKLRNNVKDNKKSVTFASSGEKKYSQDLITVDNIYYYNV
jgi:hypothetical protein